MAELLQLTEEDFQEAKADLEVTTTNKVWREILAKDKSGAAAALKGEITCQPGVRKLAAFMDYFDSNQ